DITKHTPRTIRDLHDTSFDLIISLSPEAHHQALELTRTMAVDVEYWPTFDATLMVGQGNREQILAAYRSVRDALFQRIKQRFSREGGPSVCHRPTVRGYFGGLFPPARPRIVWRTLRLLPEGPMPSRISAMLTMMLAAAAIAIGSSAASAAKRVALVIGNS